MDTDRAEMINLAATHPSIAQDLTRQWDAWAARVGVVAWDDVLAGYLAQGKSEAEAAG